MARFYVQPENIKDGQALLEKEEVKHLAQVLRLTPGQDLLLFDGQGNEYEGKLLSLEKEKAVVQLTQSSFFSGESSLEIWLGQALPKGEKMNLIVQKATELGVKGIIPLQTKYCVMQLNPTKEERRRLKWQKIALEATKQCGRTQIPTILPLSSLDQLLENLPTPCQLFIAWEKGDRSFAQVLKEKKIKETAGHLPVYLLIGPEGGFAQEEVAQVQKYGGVPVSLGPRILRTETAGLAALAVLMFAGGAWEK